MKGMKRIFFVFCALCCITVIFASGCKTSSTDSGDNSSSEEIIASDKGNLGNDKFDD